MLLLGLTLYPHSEGRNAYSYALFNLKVQTNIQSATLLAERGFELTTIVPEFDALDHSATDP